MKRTTPTSVDLAVAAERDRIAGEARLAKGASVWMGRESFDMLIRRIYDPKCDPYRSARASGRRGTR